MHIQRLVLVLPIRRSIHTGILLAAIRTPHDHRTVEVNDLVVQPLAWPESFYIRIGDLLFGIFGYRPAFSKELGHRFFFFWR